MSPLKLNVPLPSLGLVADRPGEFVDQRAAAAMRNMEYNRAVLRSRLGTLAVGASLGERIQRYFELQVGNETRLFRVGQTKVEVLNKATGVWSSVASAALTGGVDNQISYASPLLGGEKTAVFTNGVDPIRKCGISGNDAALAGAPPLARYVQAFGGYLVLGYVTEGGTPRYSRVQWCDTGDPETWAGGNAGSEDLLEDPDDITGLGVYSNFLTIHKAGAIYLGQLVTTSDVFRFDRRATGVGACAGATIQNIPSGEQIFLAADGIHLFNGLTAPLIESPIQDELREGMNPLYLYKAQSIFVRELDEYWVCVPMGSDTEPTTVYKYNWRTRQMYKDTRANLTALGVYVNTQEDTWADRQQTWDDDPSRWDSIVNLSLAPIVILGDSAGKSTKRSGNTNDDDGTAVERLTETKDFTALDAGLPDADRLMRWKGLQVWAKGTSVKLYYSTDGGTTWQIAAALTLASDYPTDAAPLNVYFDKVSSRIRFRFLNSEAEGSYTLEKYIVIADPREARR
jgi:hypothetical protein